MNNLAIFNLETKQPFFNINNSSRWDGNWSFSMIEMYGDNWFLMYGEHLCSRFVLHLWYVLNKAIQICSFITGMMKMIMIFSYKL